MKIKAQASLEAIVSSGFLLILLVFVIYNYIIMQENNSRISKETLQKLDCLKISAIANSQKDFYHNSQVTLEVSYPFSIDNNTIIFSDYYCKAPFGIRKDVNQGLIVIKMQEGVFDVYNTNG
ncbi:MAG: hypothetical protein QXD98_03470 [Candidatus Diapherotrites archaeon]